jgi:tetraacyldisaccharide 4'-kinase
LDGNFLVSTLLFPFELLYRAGLGFWYLYWRVKGRREFRIPVVSVGNLTVGGAGKTPFTIYLAEELKRLGQSPVILTRGYLRKKRGFVPMVRGERSVEEVGDEALLIFRRLDGSVPVLVDKDRIGSIEWALKNLSPTLFILDDAHQYLSIDPSLSILLIPVEDLREKVRLLPRGRYREPPSATRRADCVILNEKFSGSMVNIPDWVKKNLKGPIFRMKYITKGLVGKGVVLDVEKIKGEKVVAFAGIADPGGFFRTLEAMGTQLLDSYPFPDHHSYSEDEIRQIEERAKTLKAAFVLTTEKDMVRIENPPQNFYALGIDVEVDKEFWEWFWGFISSP